MHFLVFSANVFMLTNHPAPVVIGGGIRSFKVLFHV